MILNEDYIHEDLKTSIIGKNLILLDSVNSTNNYARALIQQGFSEGVVIADSQTKGRGRFGKNWYSPPEMGVWMSVILPSMKNDNSFVNMSYISTLSVVEALNDTAKLKTEIKWPNDVLIKQRKIAGILSEVVKLNNEKSFVVSGIGVNINYEYEKFPPELREIATSLSIVTGSKFPREMIIASILNILEKNYSAALEHGTDYIFTEWMKRCTTIGRRIRVVQSEKYFEGTAESIKPDGRLLIRNSRNDIIEITPSDIIKVIEYI